MPRNAECLRPRHAAFVLATSLLAACARGDSEVPAPLGCLPVPQYSPELQARAAEELERLPEGSAIEEMLGDYSALRQFRCSPPSNR
ncbi:hypothetical protein SAMN05421751_12514 [Jhaorihella thermophila]|uniref:Uncharacterized protein n=1 Tax=Jhaorihella thermophila TaxID=488547 RepID=A0A1H5Z1L9_9RHOB|nr:hypothetical protein SAMN05421751_12514 [Jhaorihella thermophila]